MQNLNVFKSATLQLQVQLTACRESALPLVWLTDPCFIRLQEEAMSTHKHAILQQHSQIPLL